MRNVIICLLLFSFSAVLFGQEQSAKPLIAPGGLYTIPPSIDYESVTSRADIPEILHLLPDHAPELQNDLRFRKETWARDIRFARNVWCLQFSFKPLRIVDVDVPNAEGNYDKKKVWYLVYNVKNLGSSLPAEKQLNSALGSEVPSGNEKTLPVPADKTASDSPRAAMLEVRQQTGTFEVGAGKAEAIRFEPQFVLTAHRLVLNTASANSPETGKVELQTEEKPISYQDRIIPLALPAIIRREGMTAVPETTVSMPMKEIALGQDYWGVAMWTDIDPRIHEFSIYVSGLTNAYHRVDKVVADGTYENAGKIGEGRVIKRRVLKTDWWRVGDQYTVNDSQIRFGSKEGLMPLSIFDLKGDFNRDGKVDVEERKRFEAIYKEADTNGDGWVSDAERAEYHRVHQDWLNPTYGYEWLFL